MFSLPGKGLKIHLNLTYNFTFRIELKNCIQKENAYKQQSKDGFLQIRIKTFGRCKCMLY